MSKMEKNENEEKKFGVKNEMKHIYVILSGWKADQMGENEEKNFFWMPVPGLELTTFGSMCTVNISIHNNRKKNP